MTIEELQECCAANGLPLSNEELAKLSHYATLLREWNERINLISRKDEDNIVERHVLHSLTLRMPAVCTHDFSSKRIADVGTGGGLPGIPLAIITSSAQFTLIDSTTKKIVADAAMIKQLEITNASAIAGRAEELARQPEHRAVYDTIVSRAVAPLDDLIKWTRGLLQPGATLYSLKGGDLEAECRRASSLPFVQRVTKKMLQLKNYDSFAREDKQLVRVDFK